MITDEERRRRQVLERSYLKCRCGNTARLGEQLCGRCLEEEAREQSISSEFASLHHRIQSLPDFPDDALDLRSILSDIVGLLEGTVK